MKRLSQTNANYWRAFCGVQIVWMDEHIQELRKRAYADYEEKCGDEGEAEMRLICGFSEVDPAEIMAACHQRYGIHDLLALQDRWKRERRDQLDHLAKFVDFEPTDATHRLMVTNALDKYLSYAERAREYTRGELAPYEDKLKQLDFTCEITFSDSIYVLWGNCQPWMFDALKRQITLTEATRSFESRGLLPIAYGLKGFLR